MNNELLLTDLKIESNYDKVSDIYKCPVTISLSKAGSSGFFLPYDIKFVTSKEPNKLIFVTKKSI